jgi:hypothetical protein
MVWSALWRPSQWTWGLAFEQGHWAIHHGTKPRDYFYLFFTFDETRHYSIVISFLERARKVTDLVDTTFMAVV